ncbi:hypothetical protein GGR51DRAFT_566450 [Nemania sp. FL0031]|nr:hypothetical protein GGR51DRAFT_566450 [Nemania sp. FL0031]
MKLLQGSLVTLTLAVVISTAANPQNHDQLQSRGIPQVIDAVQARGPSPDSTPTLTEKPTPNIVEAAATVTKTVYSCRSGAQQVSPLMAAAVILPVGLIVSALI